MAPGWARRREQVWDATRPVSERMVELLGPRPGETLLELAAGVGDTGFLAAPRLAPGGRLVSTDVAPEMVAAAAERAAELGLDDVETAVCDAEGIPFADESVDAVACRFGLMLVPDPGRALVEIRRVLRPEGRTALAVWAGGRENPSLSAVGYAAVELGLLDRPGPDAPGPFRLADPQKLHGLVSAAGLSLRTAEDVTVTWRYESLEDWWATTLDLSSTVRRLLQSVPGDGIESLRERAAGMLERFTQPGGRLAVPGRARVVLAQRTAGAQASE